MRYSFLIVLACTVALHGMDLRKQQQKNDLRYAQALELLESDAAAAQERLDAILHDTTSGRSAYSQQTLSGLGYHLAWLYFTNIGGTRWWDETRRLSSLVLQSYRPEFPAEWRINSKLMAALVTHDDSPDGSARKQLLRTSIRDAENYGKEHALDERTRFSLDSARLELARAIVPDGATPEAVALYKRAARDFQKNPFAHAQLNETTQHRLKTARKALHEALNKGLREFSARQAAGLYID